MLKPKIMPLLILLVMAFAPASKIFAKNMLYFVDVCRFYATDSRPYIEVYLNIEGPTVQYVQGDDDKFRANVALTYEVKKVENLDGEAVFSKEVLLESPAISDTSVQSTAFGFMDARRISLEPGRYMLIGTMKDQNDPKNRTHMFERELLIEEMPASASTSDMEFIQYFRKSKVATPVTKLGYDIMPLISNASFMDADSIHFYMELYNTDKQAEGRIFVNTYIAAANSESPLEGYTQSVKKTPKPLDILTGSFDVSKLPSQTYYLKVEVYNQKNEIIASNAEKIFVYNSRILVNPTVEAADMEDDFGKYFSLTEEDLDYYIPTLMYISTPTEKDFAHGLRNLQEKQNYFYNFWRKRKPDNVPISAEWKNYKARVAYANENYKSVYQDGWKTARGRVILTYGPPNDIERFYYENDSYPYELWSYNRINTQANVIFVFYDPDRATEDWPLLHSSKLGEYNNPRWRLDLVRRSVHEGNLDRNNSGDFTRPGRQ